MDNEELMIRFSKAGLTALSDIHVLSGGYTDFACTAVSGGEKYVLKTISPNYIADERPSFLRMEIDAYRLLENYPHIPIPKVYYSDLSTPNDEFIVMQFVKGKMPRVSDYSSGTAPEEWDKIGKLIADFHRIDPPEGMKIGFPRMGGMQDNWYQAARETVLDAKRMLGQNKKYLNRLLDEVDKFRSILENVKTTYIHGDMWVNNLIRQDDGSLVLFDLGDCMVGDPMMDLLFFDALRPLPEKKALLDAYNRYAKQKVTATYEEQVRFFICMGLYGIQDIDHLYSYRHIPLSRKIALKAWLDYYVYTGLKGLRQLEK